MHLMMHSSIPLCSHMEQLATASIWWPGLLLDRMDKNSHSCSTTAVYYHIIVREGNNILQMRRLFQQFLVDVDCMIETERLGFIRREKKNLLADNCDNLCDSVMSTDDEC